MVQSAALDRLPVTANSKLDRPAPPAPHQVRRSGRPPRTPDERLMCDLFADVLEVATVGIDDGFFELGGHSLRAPDPGHARARDQGP